jgi:hypothetical protein
MKNKKLWLGILVIVLVFGMAVVGCDDGTTNGSDNSNEKGDGNSNENGNGNGNGNDGGVVNPFIGSWKRSDSGVTQTITFYSDLTLSWVITGIAGSTSNGTYSYNGNTATIHVNGVTGTITLNNSSSLNMGGYTYYKQ